MLITRSLKFILCVVIFQFSLQATASSGTFQPFHGSKAIVVTADARATEAGVKILKSGGNSIDAAVAVAFTLAVTYPTAGNIGGGGFLIFRDQDNQIFTLDFREKAPLAARERMYLDSSNVVLPNRSTLGYLAAGTPGTVDGLWRAHQRFGRTSWAKLLKPAIDLAEKGFILDASDAAVLQNAHHNLVKFPSSRRIFCKSDQPLKAGDRLIQRDLAGALRRIANMGRDGFYLGETALLIERDMQKNNGLITTEDLLQYESVWREPIEISYRSHRIFSMPLPSSGGVLLAEILNSLESFNLQMIGLNTAHEIHLWTEIERRAYAERSVWLGDSDFTDVPVSELISKQHAQKIINSLPYFLAGNSGQVSGREFVQRESEETTHFSIADEQGNAVSLTYTLNGSFGSCAVAEGTGILLNNEMDDFSIKPGIPNMFGLVGGAANAIAPGKRMLSSMTPTIVTRNDSLLMVIGSPGGSTIITTVAQIISNVIDRQMNIRMAIEAPRFHHQWLPDLVYMESNGFSDDTITLLKGMGYQLERRESIGLAQGILIDWKTGGLTGWSDPRGSGHVSGY
jgi:gamma-glutamyltranspeptidase/glutathione hydrolase